MTELATKVLDLRGLDALAETAAKAVEKLPSAATTEAGERIAALGGTIREDGLPLCQCGRSLFYNPSTCRFACPPCGIVEA